MNNLTTIDLDKQPVAELEDLSDQIPVIDMSLLFGSEAGDSARNNIIKEVETACRNWGFFQVINHGISSELITKVKQQCALFFKQTARQKDEVRRTFENPWGYYNNELTKNQRDKKEVFDFTVPGVDPIYSGTNRWPRDFPSSGIFLEYQAQCVILASHLTQVFCAGLGLPNDTLNSHFVNHTGFTRLNYYPVSDPLHGSTVEHLPTADLGVHHHTDAGILTVLLQDQVGGLQVYREGYWHNVKPIENAVVINTGDMMQVWSNNQYMAAMHRVLAMDSKDRYSIPFFFNPSADSEILPLPPTVTASKPAQYRSINWGKFRNGRTSGDYADYGKEVQISDFLI